MKQARTRDWQFGAVVDGADVSNRFLRTANDSTGEKVLCSQKL